MSTFIVRFVDEMAGSFRGKVQHVADGEELVFTDESELLAFFERMNILRALARANAELVEAHHTDGSDDDAPADAASSVGAPPKVTDGVDS
ncbi:MAG: hypothetical protein KJ970_13600 [Candidatus Eisenbacteria bacterium]|uniref:Uncharacterized protein n=1 Tax=Eiseniibacteriota bacterium TaxID=2212470 RepID=A0A948RYK0_UNCEI|nr:hypothetical protein [Candidatus Eisenbacteria bacterium]MBU1947612.1 hypothetical protein [Candidatus Eisenbacteria bacterium]MBU2691949.1 hypothetical protein [Candidatus Eisenbacteria bacterium]